VLVMALCAEQGLAGSFQEDINDEILELSAART
jgi:hypothetical protein